MINKTDEIKYEIKQKLLDRFRVFLLIFVLLIVPLAFIRSKGVFTPVVIITLIVAIISLALHVFKEKVSLNFKIYIIAVLLGSVIINGLINFGIIASAKSFIILLSVFLSYILPLKRTYTFLFVFLSIYAIFAFLYINGYLTYNFNIINQISQPAFWFVDGAVLLIVSVLLIQVGNSINFQLTKNLDDLLDSKAILKDREEKYKSLFDNDKLAVIILKDKVIIECNLKALELFKCKEEDIIGKEPYELSPKYQPDGILSKEKAQTLEDFTNKNPSNNLNPEWQHINSQGELFLVSTSITPISLSTGSFVYIVLKDITNERKTALELDVYRKKLETLVEKRTIELSQSNVQLENSLEREKELGKLKTSFVAMASHEFRTPLAAIKAATDVILKYNDKLSQEDIKKRLFKIKREVSDMNIMLEDILIIGKADSQKLQFNAIEQNLVVLVKNIILEYQLTQVEVREVIYKLSMDKIMISVDPKWIKHIVINLFSNALKYSEAPSSITIEIRQEENEVILSVTDKGIGISKKDQESLFEPFHRGENVGNIEGTGLGLSVLQTAIDLHKGKIKVESKLNNGSTFIVSLPYEGTI